jgi:hypothetical protein
MSDLSAGTFFLFGVVAAAASALGVWAYLRYGLQLERPWSSLRRLTGPTYVVVGLFELSAGYVTYLRGDGRFWLPVVLGIALVVGGGYYIGRRTIS